LWRLRHNTEDADDIALGQAGDDSLDQLSQLLECLALLRQVIIAIVHLLHARQHVSEAMLGARRPSRPEPILMRSSSSRGSIAIYAAPRGP
jgi:hypothetical protein